MESGFNASKEFLWSSQVRSMSVVTNFNIVPSNDVYNSVHIRIHIIGGHTYTIKSPHKAEVWISIEWTESSFSWTAVTGIFRFQVHDATLLLAIRSTRCTVLPIFAGSGGPRN
jgi:hypothetical protein